MPSQKKLSAETEASSGMLKLTPEKDLPANSVLANAMKPGYKYRYTSGPFLLPHNAGSLDWTIINNDSTQQKVQVTVFRCPVGAAKVAMPPGPLQVTIPANQSTHNANTYGTGFAYEVVVECNSQLLFPYVSVWPSNFGEVIPGTGINSGMFLRTMP